MTSSLLIKNLKFDKFGDFSSDIDFKTKMDIFRDDISLIINQCHLQATEGSLRRIRSVCQPRSASKRSTLVYIYIYICNQLIEETARLRKLIFVQLDSFGNASLISDLREMSTHHGFMTSLSPFYNLIYHFFIHNSAI